MTFMARSLRSRTPGKARIFTACARRDFKASYPETAHKLEHRLASNLLLELDALALLGETLPPGSVEYNRGDLPIGVNGKPAGNGLTIGQTIRSIKTSNSWAVLKNIEQKAPYARLLAEMLDELRPIIEKRTGTMLEMQGFIFISSPGAVTPYHFDPEHNVLLQLRGNKAMTVFPAGNPRFAPDRTHEAYHTGGARELHWEDGFEKSGTTFNLHQGQAVYVPVMAPHYVKNGKDVSVSLSITWRSTWSYAEADARAFNALLRRYGLSPRAPRRWPASNRIKATAWRIARRVARLP